jgi:hypothetical protein
MYRNPYDDIFLKLVNLCYTFSVHSVPSDFLIINNNHIIRGTLLVAQLVEVLRYKPEGLGFHSR